MAAQAPASGATDHPRPKMELYPELQEQQPGAVISRAPVRYTVEQQQAREQESKNRNAQLAPKVINRPTAKPKNPAHIAPRAVPIIKRSTSDALDDGDHPERSTNFWLNQNKEMEAQGKKRKGKRKGNASELDWDSIYDPSRPTIYAQYSGSEEQELARREWKARLYFHVDRKRRSRNSETLQATDYGKDTAGLPLSVEVSSGFPQWNPASTRAETETNHDPNRSHMQPVLANIDGHTVTPVPVSEQAEEAEAMLIDSILIESDQPPQNRPANKAKPKSKAMLMMEKMGWKGQGLGVHEDGIMNPVKLEKGRNGLGKMSGGEKEVKPCNITVSGMLTGMDIAYERDHNDLLGKLGNDFERYGAVERIKITPDSSDIIVVYKEPQSAQNAHDALQKEQRPGIIVHIDPSKKVRINVSKDA